MARFLESIDTFAYELVVPEIIDYTRSAEILRKYNDQNIDFVDACIVAMAERLNFRTILTVDRRHFSISSPSIAIRLNCCRNRSFNITANTRYKDSHRKGLER